MDYDVIGIGNALVDIQTEVNDDFLKKLNFTKGGMTLSTKEEQQKLLSSLKEYTLNLCSGGSAANTIHGIGTLGGHACYLGRVANDEYGNIYAEDMQKCGVGFPGPGDETSGTGTSVVLITPDAQRTMITELGISAKLSPDNVHESIVEGAGIVYIEGYLWCNENTKAAGIKLAEIAKRKGIRIAFTLSDAFVVNSFHTEIMDFINQYVDILFCNEVEGVSMAQEKDSQKAFDQIKKMVTTLFFTIGEKGALASSQDNEIIQIKGNKVNAMDTTGAGDLFAAGAIQGITTGKTIRESAMIGCYCASQVITHFGARLPARSHKNISEILGSCS